MPRWRPRLRVLALQAALLNFATLSTAQSPREKMQEALRFQQAGELAKAEALFREIIREEPEHGAARLQLGRIALSRGEWDEAEEHLEIAVRSDPQRLFLAWYLLGRARFNKEDFDGAKKAFQEAVEKAPAFKPAWLMMAETAEKEGDDWEALRVYRKIVELAPTEVDVWAKMANLARTMGAFDLAESSVREALRGRPNDGSLYYLLAFIQKESGQTDAALASCETALELGFREAPVYVTMGDLYYERMDMTQSIAALAKAVEIDPAAAESIASFALSSLTTEDFAALQSLLEKHLETHPDNLNTLYSLGVMYVRENRLDEAKKCFLHLKELAPDHTEVYYNLGLIYMREGNVEEGQAAMARFQELKAEEAEKFNRNKHAVTQRQEAKDLIAAGERDKAILVYTELMKEGLADLQDVLSLCNLYLSLGHYTPASSCFQNVLQVSPYHKEALAGLAEAAQGLGNEQVARQCRDRLELLTPPVTEAK
jgi:tetratricopeptide (TPR) repeat protein